MRAKMGIARAGAARMMKTWEGLGRNGSPNRSEKLSQHRNVKATASKRISTQRLRLRELREIRSRRRFSAGDTANIFMRGLQLLASRTVDAVPPSSGTARHSLLSRQRRQALAKIAHPLSRSRKP